MIQGTYCTGGEERRHHCRLVCVGGYFDGYACSVNSDCWELDGGVIGTCADVPESKDCPPAGRCERWTPDPVTGTCVGSSNNPFCNTVADCPTTKYCANDPQSFRGGSNSCYDDATDDCCTGGTDFGPCMVWDTCDTVNHICVRTHRGGTTKTCGARVRFTYGDAPCPGGVAGLSGSVCNDVCRAGRCSHDFAACQ